MTKVLKLVLLGLTVWPLLFFIIFIFSGVIEPFYSFSSINTNTLAALTFATGLISLSMAVFYFIELYHNHSINGQSKMKWFILFLLTGSIGRVLYWKKFFW